MCNTENGRAAAAVPYPLCFVQHPSIPFLYDQSMQQSSQTQSWQLAFKKPQVSFQPWGDASILGGSDVVAAATLQMSLSSAQLLHQILLRQATQK